MSGTGTPPGILIVTDVYPPVAGGSGWSTHALVQALLERGHRVEVMEVDATSEGEQLREHDGVAVAGIGVAGARKSLRRRLGADDYATQRVGEAVASRLAREPQLQVVHGQHLHSAPGAIRAARQAGRAAVVTLRDYWPVCLHGTSWWGDSHCPGCTTARLTGCMHEVYGLPRPASLALVPWARRRLDARRTAVASAHRIIAVSESVRGLIIDRAPELRIDVVPNMVDPGRSAAAAERGAERDLPGGYLLAAGKLNAAKGFDRIVDELAAAGCSRPLVVAGEGPANAGMRERAAALGIELVLCGWVGGDDLLRLMRDARAVVLPSAWAEPLSRVLLEALSVGTPVIARRSGGSAEAIDDGVNGWLIDSRESLAQALEQLDDAVQWQEARAAARRIVAERFVPEVVCPRVERLYREAIAAGDSQAERPA